jgi:hypothetical protein
MSIDPKHLRLYVIRPACETIGLYSLAAEELLLGTACQESSCGRYLHQLGAGPACGIFEMEPATHDDHWAWLAGRPELAAKVSRLTFACNAHEMAWNLQYGAAMCRIHYYRVKDPLPSAGDLSGQAAYWKQHYNTPGGAGTVQQYVKNLNRFVNPSGGE